MYVYIYSKMFSMSMSLKWDAIRSRFPVFFPTCQVRVSRFQQRCNSFLSFISFFSSPSFSPSLLPRQLRMLWRVPGLDRHIASAGGCGVGLDLNCQRMPERMSDRPECMSERMPERLKVCQIECQNACLKRCQIECQKKCQNRCQIESQNRCQKVC